ncbi:MAG: ATP-binding cassette domain-containing protein [Pseudomonadota bacterium]
MLAVKQLGVFVGETRLLGPIDFEIEAGSTLVIMGETGAGKSLIAQSLMGNLPSSLSREGAIAWQGKRLDKLPEDEVESLWGREIALLPQEPWLALDPIMPAFYQVEETHHLVSGVPKATAREKTQDDFQRIGLQGSEHRRPGELSGGMNQRVAFAATVAGHAKLLLVDEPTKGLDLERSQYIVAQLKQLQASGSAIIVITHSVETAREIGGELIVLREGVCVERDQSENVLNSPQHEYTQRLVDSDPSRWTPVETDKSDHVVLKVRDLSAGHRRTPLIENFDLTLFAGERVALTGPSGIGKTTLLDTLSGLIPQLKGFLEKGSSVGRTGIQKIFQDPPTAFVEHVNLKTSLLDVAKLHDIDWSEIEQLLKELQIDLAMLERRPSEVSGGELQRIAIARALSVKPAILLADEPTSRLDPLTQQETMALLGSSCAASNTSVVLVTHDGVLAEKWSDRVIDVSNFIADSDNEQVIRGVSKREQRGR